MTSQPTQNDHVVVACHAWYDDLIGGSFRLASEFARHLAKIGYRTSYVCCDVNATRVDNETHGNLTIRRYPCPSGQGSWGRLRHHVRQTRQLIAALHAEQPVTAISSHSPLQGLGAALAAKSQSVRVNYTVHSPFDDEILSNVDGHPRLTKRLVAMLARRVDRRNVKLASVLQTDSNYTMDIFRERFGKTATAHGTVAPGWVETDCFEPVADRRGLRSELGGHWDTNHPVFFTLRRLQNRMGLETLVESCRRLRDNGLTFRALIGGDGPIRSQLEQQIRDNELQSCVFLLGRLPEDQLTNCYAAADCFVLPTRALECFGLIVLEAFSCHTPVIASKVAAIPELASRQGDEWMFDPGNAKQLYDRMASFLDGSLKPTQNLRGIAEEFDKPRILAQWTHLLLGSKAND